MRNRSLDKDVVIVLISTLLTVTSWVGFEVYRAYAEINLPEAVEKHLTPLNPQIDYTTIEKLEKLNP